MTEQCSNFPPNPNLLIGVSELGVSLVFGVWRVVFTSIALLPPLC